MNEANLRKLIESTVPVPPKVDELHAYTEIYKQYVETMEKVMARRQIVSSFFLSINVLLFGGVGLCATSAGDAFLLQFGSMILAALGLFVCVTWYRLLAHYRLVSRGKSAVIHTLEGHLPARPFCGEQIAFESEGYVPLSRIEGLVPLAFGIVHALIVVLFVYNLVRG